jgi:Xaa-Pro aminopeptidase
MSELKDVRGDEKAYRWGMARAFLRERGLDGLVIFGSDRSDRYDAGQYLFRDRRYQHAVFPLEGEPVMIGFAAQVALQNMVSRERGLESWIEDIRIGRVAELMPELIEEKGLANRRLGVIGLGWGGPFFPGGWVSASLAEAVKSKLPKAELVDVTQAFGLMMMRKSAADIECVAAAAAAGDSAMQLMMDTAGPGVSEKDVYSAGFVAMLERQMRVTWLLMQTGLENCSWGEPSWLMRPEPPRRLVDQDIVGAELFPNYAEMNCHVNMSFTVGSVDPTTRRCGDIARQSYEQGLNAIKAGASFQTICAAMDEPLTEANAWHLTPQIAALNPLYAGGTSGLGVREQLPEFARRYPHADGGEGTPFDFALEEGMTLSLQADARLGRHWANLGGMVVVTRDGCRELNQLSTRLRHVE